MHHLVESDGLALLSFALFLSLYCTPTGVVDVVRLSAVPACDILVYVRWYCTCSGVLSRAFYTLIRKLNQSQLGSCLLHTAQYRCDWLYLIQTHRPPPPESFRFS